MYDIPSIKNMSYIESKVAVQSKLHMSQHHMELTYKTMGKTILINRTLCTHITKVSYHMLWHRFQACMYPVDMDNMKQETSY